MKRNIKIGMRVLFMAMLLVSIAFVPAVCAQQVDNGKQQVGNGINESVSTESLVPYATINAYGPSQADPDEEISIYTSGEIGNIITIYYQKFYIMNLDTNDATGVEYTSTPNDWSCILGTWSKMDSVWSHETFSSSWKVELTQSGTYEVVASVVGVGTIPNDQDRFTITVS